VLPDRLTAGRAALAILAVSLVSLLFIASYPGALHAPSPDEVPVAITAQVPDDAAAKIDASPAFRVIRVADPAAAVRAIDRRDAYAAIVAGSRGLERTTAPAAGPAAQQAVLDGLAPQLRSAVADVTVRTVHPLPRADARGLVGFYTAVGWIVAGYLGATFLGIVFGTRPSTRRTVWRIGGLLALSVIVGFGGAVLADVIGDTGHVLLIGVIGMLTTAAAGIVTTALQAAFGIIGTGVAILLFVVLGNPSSGGPFPPELLPEPWQTIGPYLPTGAATTAIRDIAYFPDAPLGKPFLVLGAWILVGAVAALLLSRGRHSPGERDHALAAIAAP
jgi:hypothetical protein